MRWLSFERDGKATFGVVTGEAGSEGVVDVGALEPGLADLRAAIASGRLAAIGAASSGRPADLPLAGLTLLPVVTNPAKILCAGLNYRDHQAETGRGGEPYPTIFTRFAAAQVAHGQAMWRPRESANLDFEGEIALIIGKGGRRIAKADWLSHVAGFAPYNDGSVRDWQRHTSQFTPGKNFARTGGFGPWMMTPDEVGDPASLELTTRLNGQVVQHATSSQMVFGFGELVEYCSAFIELEAGDVIVTGTPGGVGAARTPPLWMKPGDRIEVEVKPVGTLVNLVEEG
jgi:2-keto-4-pentenoate hydratase/2-oxohepta-3-ene-1,7-dioic acid hydratase in catechol pathway